MCETIGQRNDIIKSKMAACGKLKRVVFSVFDEYEMLYLPCPITFVIWTPYFGQLNVNLFQEPRFPLIQGLIQKWTTYLTFLLAVPSVFV